MPGHNLPIVVAAMESSLSPSLSTETTTSPPQSANILTRVLALGRARGGDSNFGPLELLSASRTNKHARELALHALAATLARIGWGERVPCGLDAGAPAVCRLLAARVLEGFVVALPPADGAADAAAAARVRDLLRAFGARVVVPPPVREDGYDFRVSFDGTVGFLDETLVVPAAALELFVFSPFTRHTQSFKSGAELDDAQAAEVLEGYLNHQESTTLDGVRSWGKQDETPGDETPNWQDLSLRTFVNVRTGDAIREWNYGLGDNDFGSYHFTDPTTGGSVPLGTNYDGDREFDNDALDAFAASGDGDGALVRRVLAGFMQMEEPGMRSGLPSSEKRGGWVHDFSLGVSPAEIVRNPDERVKRWRARIDRMHNEMSENDGDVPHWWSDWYDDQEPEGEEGDLDGPIEALARSVEKGMS